MPWYKTGTVSVTLNSNAVIGTGTAFIANSRVGDGFRGPDGGWYEVTNIASDTAMSISPNYQGATNATGGYALAPLQGYVKDSADALRAMVNQFGAMLSGLSVSGTDGLVEGSANKYFTPARVLATPMAGLVTTVNSAVAATDSLLIATGKLQAQVSAALPKTGGTLTGPINDAPTPTIASAASIDIGAATSSVITISGTTAITGLGTIALGARRTLRFLGALVLTYNPTSLILPTGTNITTAANDTAEFLSLGVGNWLCLRYNLASGKALSVVTPGFAYDRSNILGTVSQSSGAPSGAIIETITNANGTAVKFANGTMICLWQTSGFVLNANSYGNFGPYTLPATFISTSSVVPAGTAIPNTTYDFFGIAVVNVTSTNTFVIVIRNGATAQSASANLIFIGRWF